MSKKLEEDKMTLAVETWKEMMAGVSPSTESVERVAKLFNVDVEPLKKAILQDGLDEEWLLAEYFDGPGR